MGSLNVRIFSNNLPKAAGDGSMLALMGRGAAERAAEIAEAHGLAVANDNSPQQVVLSGDRSGFEAHLGGSPS